MTNVISASSMVHELTTKTVNISICVNCPQDYYEDAFDNSSNTTNLSIKLCSALNSKVRHSYEIPFSHEPCSISAGKQSYIILTTHIEFINRKAQMTML